MSDPKSINPEVVVVWGAHPGYQYERDWLLQLLRPLYLHEVEWHQQIETFVLPSSGKVVLVESARHLLQGEICQLNLEVFAKQRAQRLQTLQDVPHLIIWHISDEEGLDGDRWYPALPPQRTVLREFPHPRFERFQQVVNLPLGPTRAAMRNVPWLPASCRQHPWCFMGTLWPSTTRGQAVAWFQQQIPGGVLHGSEGFGQGLAPDLYAFQLHQSRFSLCPEGNRHFETFRFYESLELGAIPLTLLTPAELNPLFNEPWPLPCFSSWEQAAGFAQAFLADPPAMDALQWRLRCWWEAERHRAAFRLHNSLETAGVMP
jgi:hypothetical protein